VHPDPVGSETNFWPDPEKIISDPDPGSFESEMNGKLMNTAQFPSKMHNFNKIQFLKNIL
jgi:hypothetical protein